MQALRAPKGLSKILRGKKNLSLGLTVPHGEIVHVQLKHQPRQNFLSNHVGY